MDADYLKSTVGDALAAALTSLAMKQPKDPVDFLGHYLATYANHLEGEKKKTELVKVLEVKINDLAKEEARKKRENEEKVAQEKKALEDRNNRVASLSETTVADTMFVAVLESVKSATGASAAYIGKKVDMGPEAPAVVKYLSGSQGSEFMVGQVLQGPNPSSEEEETGEEGVTFRLWKELPPPPAPEGEEQEEGEQEAAPPQAIYPEYLHIENVIRDGAVKYFGVPKLGAYLALPVTYYSGLHDDGIGMPPPPTPSEEEGEQQQPGGDESTAGGSIDAGSAGAGEEAAAAPPADAATGPVPTPAAAAPPAIIKVPKRVDLVLGLDSMGQARPFTPEEIQSALFWSKHLASALEKAEDQLWQEEVVRVQAFTAEEQAARNPHITELKEKLTEALKVLEGVEDSPAKKVQEKTLVFDVIKEGIRLVRPHLSQLSTLLIKPKALYLFKLLQVVYLTLYPANTTTDLSTWDAVRALLDKEFWDRFEAFDPNHNSGSPPSKDDIEKLRGMLDGIMESELEVVSLESYLWYRWLVSSMDLADALAEKKEADDAAALAAAEEAAAAAAAAAEAAEAEGEGDEGGEGEPANE